MYLINKLAGGRGVILSSCLLAIIGTGVAQAQSTQMRDGLLADPAGLSLFSMNPAGGVDAINAIDGSIRWHSNSAQRPVLLQQARLVAQGSPAARSNELNLVLLDADNGQALAARIVALPEAVQVSINDSLQSRFSVAPVTGQFLAWQNERRLVQGMFTEHQPSQTQQTGALSVDLNSGDVATVPVARLPARPANPINAQPQEQLQAVTGRQFVSADRAHILVSQRRSGDSLQPYQWDIYNASGTLLGSISEQFSRSDFMVFNEAVLVYVAEPVQIRADNEMVAYPLRLVAVELATGHSLWSQPIRDTRYQGPYPP